MWGKILFIFIERAIEFLFRKLAEYKARRHEKRNKKRHKGDLLMGKDHAPHDGL